MSPRRWTQADLDRVQDLRYGEAPRPPRPEAREDAGRPHDPLRGATQLERRFAAWLGEQLQAGAVAAWRFQPTTLVLSREGRGLRYTPDFGVTVAVLQPGAEWGTPALELVEVKPRRRDNPTEPLWLGDSRTKVMAAAEWGRWAPWSLVLVLPNADGTWERRVL